MGGGDFSARLYRYTGVDMRKRVIDTEDHKDALANAQKIAASRYAANLSALQTLHERAQNLTLEKNEAAELASLTSKVVAQADLRIDSMPLCTQLKQLQRLNDLSAHLCFFIAQHNSTRSNSSASSTAATDETEVLFSLTTAAHMELQKRTTEDQVAIYITQMRALMSPLLTTEPLSSANKELLRRLNALATRQSEATSYLEELQALLREIEALRAPTEEAGEEVEEEKA